MVHLMNMLEIKDISVFLKPYIAALKDKENAIKKVVGDKRKDDYDEFDLPKFSNAYVDANKLLNSMLVHYDRDNIPFELIDKNAPNEDESQRRYRIDNYEPLTLPYFHKAVGILKRVCNRSNVKIEYQTDEQREYFTNIPTFGSIFNYFDQIVINQKAIDPNAVLGVKMFEFPIVETEDGFSIDETERLSPLPKIYSSRQVLEYSEGRHLLFWSNEKSVVISNKQEVKKGNIFEFWDTQSYYEIRQVGKYEDFKFEVIKIYTHGLGKLPAQKLKGQPIFKRDSLIYHSYFMPAIPNLNRALYLSSNLDISLVTQMYPQKWRYVSKCTNPECENGYETIPDTYSEHTDIKRIKCRTCGGTGQHQSIMGELQITLPSNDNALNNDNVAAMPSQPFGYVAPPSSPLETVDERIKYLIRTAFTNINIDITEKPNGQTATEKKIDKDELINFISGFSRETYSLLQFVYDISGVIRWGGGYKTVSITEPTSFDIRTEDDLMRELETMNTVDMTPSVRANVIKDYIGKRFPDDELIVKSIPIMDATDRLLGLSNEQIRNDVAAGRIEKYEKVIHDSFDYIIQEAIREDVDFLERDIEAQKQKVTDIAKLLVLDEQNLVDRIINGTAA